MTVVPQDIRVWRTKNEDAKLPMCATAGAKTDR
jgi:hypothetical protein